MIDLIALIETVGYVGIFLIIFAESGILLGFFLPGDSLLFAAGLLCASGLLNIYLLIAILAIAAITGDSVGYYIGRKLGPKVFRKQNSLFFNQKYIDRTSEFFKKHGAGTIFLARFISIIRTFAPVMAGVGKMDYRKFLSYNIIGGMAWSLVLPFLGYFFGRSIPNIDAYILPIVIAIIIISFIPALLQFRKVD